MLKLDSILILINDYDHNDDDDDDHNNNDDDADVCATVKVGNKHSCAVYGGQPVRTDVGFLPLSLSGLPGATSTTGTAVGSVSCPWMIQMHRGQRVNITLMNFNQQVHARYCSPHSGFTYTLYDFDDSLFQSVTLT